MSASADKIKPTTLAELAGVDVIAVGAIIRVSPDSYTLRVAQWLAGKQSRQELNIHRRVDRVENSPTKPYKEGQRVLVFLQKGSGQSYSAYGGACEGEVFLEGGRARLRFPLLPGQSESVAEEDLIDAIPELREAQFGRDDRDYAARVRLLLKSQRRLVRAATLQRLIWDATKWHDPSVLPPFRAVLLDAVVNPDCAVRATAASWLGMRLRGAGEEVLERLDELAVSGPPEARPAAALAATFIEPDDARRHVVLLRNVADAALPLEDRRAVAAEMVHIAKPRRRVTLGVPGVLVLWPGEPPERPRIAMADLRKPVLEALTAINDEDVAMGVLTYLAAMFDIPDPVPANIDPLKRAWAELFAAAQGRE